MSNVRDSLAGDVVYELTVSQRRKHQPPGLAPTETEVLAAQVRKMTGDDLVYMNHGPPANTEKSNDGKRRNHRPLSASFRHRSCLLTNVAIIYQIRDDSRIKS